MSYNPRCDGLKAVFIAAAIVALLILTAYLVGFR